ncbi:MAG: glycosyltransferase [bacterium]|nr:glycosyltransferase [Candidatus Kapabacteria bacterium]
MQLSIIIVNYNVRDLVLDSVASLRVALDGIDGEIIVVDNGSSDGAIEALNARFPEVMTIALEKNLGFGAANNIGIARARGEYTLLLNPDTIVEESTLRTMMEFMRDTPRCGIASCRVILPDGSPDQAAKRGFPSPWSSFCKVFGLSTLFPKSKLFGGYNLGHVGDNVTTRVEAISGCFMFCRTPVLRELEGFDTDFFMYGEDLDLCYRAAKKGHEIYYHPATTIIHVKGESTRRSSLDALAVFYEAMEIFAQKHFRSNIPLLLLVRSGIGLRRLIARVLERFPNIGFVFVDVAATVAGIMIGSLIKTGSAFGYPSWALPVVYGVPPAVIVACVAASGGYRIDNRSLRGTATGFLFGFFVLSALPYFFKDYAFSRGVVLLTTGVGAALGLTMRFLWLLWRGTFGRDAIRRIAFLTRQEIGPELRASVRRMFLGKPVSIIGGIAPTFSELDRLPGTHLGTVENIAKLVTTHRLTDVIVFDHKLSYSEVMRAVNLTARQPVRFHIANESLGTEVDAVHVRDNHMPDRVRRVRSRTAKSLRDRALAILLLVSMPVVYLAGRLRTAGGRDLAEVLVGGRPLVGAGPSEAPETLDPVFTVAELCDDEPLSPREIVQVEEYYRRNSSFLLDCEIIVAAIRLRNTPTHRPLVEATQTIRSAAN